MHPDTDSSTIKIRRLPFTPRPLRRLQAFTEELEFAQGFSAYCAAAGITVRVEGDASSWCEPGQGAILVADHRLAWEVLPLLCWLGQQGREDVHAIAALHSVMASVFGGIITHAETILPVMGYKRGWDKNPLMLVARFLRWRARRHYGISPDQVEQMNRDTLASCAGFAAKGEIVLFHPTGKVANALKAAWKPGIGKAIKALPDAAHETVRIAFIRIERFSRLRLFWALYRGKSGKPIEIVVQARLAQTVGQLLGDAEAIAGMTDKDVTDKLRAAYVRAMTN